ncbi:MAG: DUF4423 domain-containing protein [Alphaproteobacteria bacterium]|nr:DUF4423 domain-containing protein [Alphaproteobacteria bacterium]
MDTERIARRFLVALRGHRSQVQWSRRLGYRSNVAYAWESGRRFPTAAETFRAIGRAGHDLAAELERFYGREPPVHDLADPREVARFLDDLRGDVSITDLARRADVSRYQLTRWLSGQTQPRLPDFFAVVEAASLRLVDLIACFVDPTSIDELADLWRRIEARRTGAARLPWTQGVLRVLELGGYRALPAHDDAWVANALGVPPEVVATCVSFLADTGQIVPDGARWRPERLAVDTRLRPEVGRQLKAHWTEVARERILQGDPGQFSYNVFSVNRADLERIRELHLAYYRALRAIVSESRDAEIVAVANVQLFALER